VKLYTRVPLTDIISISKGTSIYRLPLSTELTFGKTGAYILSPLEEASRDPVQNAGFVATWHNSNQVTRVTSYSIRNSLDVSSIIPPSPLVATTSLKPALNPTLLFTRSLTRTKDPALSNILTNAALAAGAETSFAAFKVLPIDPARIRRASSSGGDGAYAEAADELSGASSCQEAVDMIVESIQRAYEDIGGADGVFVTNEDVVRCVVSLYDFTSTFSLIWHLAWWKLNE
jgi:hypothetical protein